MIFLFISLFAFGQGLPCEPPIEPSGLQAAVKTVSDSLADKPVGKVLKNACEGEIVHKGEVQKITKLPADFHLGDTIRCVKDGQMTMETINSNSIVLENKGEIRIDQFALNSRSLIATILSQLSGSVKYLINGKQEFTVNSAVATIGVRGTHFAVKLGPELSVWTYKGHVSVKINKTGKSYQLLANNYLKSSSATQTGCFENLKPVPCQE